MRRIDPLAKIFGLFILLASLFFINRSLELIISSGFILLFILLVSLKELFLWLKRSLFFIIPIFIFNGLFREDGFIIGLSLSYKLFLAVILASLFSKYTSAQELIDGVSKILRFFHIPDKRFSQSLSLTFSFIPYFFKKFKRPKDFLSLPASIADSLNEVGGIEPVFNGDPPPSKGDFWILIPFFTFLFLAILYR